MDEEPIEALDVRLKEAGFQSFPETQEEADVVDNLLAEELAKLSVEEQDILTFDVHGLAPEIEETEELIETSLDEMEREIQKIKKKSAYEKAMKLNPNHVSSRDFRIRFLRCEYFKSKIAAKRLVLHFEKKELMFGDGEVIGRDVKVSDLSSTDLEYLKSGVLQVLPTRDISGRSVVAWVPGNFGVRGKINNRSAQRLFYYIVDTASREEESQKKGLILLVYSVGKKGPPPSLELFKKLHDIRLAMPHKVMGFHYCYDQRSMRPVVSGLGYLLDKRGRSRFRAHFGDIKKTEFLLQTFGIQVGENSPLKLVNGQFNLSWHKEWLQMRQAQEAGSSDEIQRITVPHRFDVLFGRGNIAREHTGNLRATHLVDMWQKKYDQARRFEKTAISEKLVGIIKESGGKFLKWEDSGWVEVEDDVAREKISHWFRLNRQKRAEIGGNEASSVEKQQQNKRPYQQSDGRGA